MTSHSSYLGPVLNFSIMLPVSNGLIILQVIGVMTLNQSSFRFGISIHVGVCSFEIALVFTC